MREATLFKGEELADSTGVFARVAVERGIDRIDDDGSLTYRVVGIPPQIGERVEVPLGRGGALTGGIVVALGGPELLGDLAPSKVKAIASTSGAVLPERLVTLARWMADYYVCPLGMVLMGMMPAAVKAQTGRTRVELVSLGEVHEPPGLSKALRTLLEEVRGLDAGTFPMPLRVLAGVLDRRGTAGLKKLVAAGALRIDVRTEVRAEVLPGLGEVEGGRIEVPTLTPEQDAVVRGIGACTGFGVHLLRGVTGSGKTEVYLRLIEEVLTQGGSAIVLVPEIALTPQTAGRFTRRFGPERVAVLHSGLSGSQRHREWARAAAGVARVIVGARSAVFAPFRASLIVVDEEHDHSYKQDRLPRYSARDVAIKRAQLEGCPVVLGSATPSLESWANAAAGRSRLWELRSRVAGASLPDVQIVDLREEQRVRRARDGDDRRLHLIGPTLEREIERALTDGGQVILLLNRRGFASYVWCRNAACRYVVGCDQCDSNLVVHRHEGLPAGGIVRCHHCDSEQRVPALCPACGGRLSLWGGGTQRAEDELGSKFAGLGIEEGRTMLRVDSDTMRSMRDYFETLSRFARGEVRLLIGTQMLAKGLDYPNVRLVGVLDADLSLNIPDFRSAERTFQLVSQVAGRAGRGAHAGRVVIQTYSPRAPSIVLAARHDYEAFATLELSVRARAGLPPSTRMAHVVCRDERADDAHSAARTLAEQFRQSDSLRVLGPAPCAVSRVAGHYRYAVDVIAPRVGQVQAALHAARSAGLLRSDSKTAVDVDPQSLL